MDEYFDHTGRLFRPYRKRLFYSAYNALKFVLMAAKKTEERKQARDLFVNSGLNFKEISLIVKVAQRHLSKWCKDDSWDTQKQAQNITVEKLIANWYGILKRLDDEIVTKQDGLPNPAQTDQLSKIADAIWKLSKKNNLSMYHLVLKEFLEELQVTDADDAKKFAPYMLDFLKRKASHLANDTKVG